MRFHLDYLEVAKSERKYISDFTILDANYRQLRRLFSTHSPILLQLGNGKISRFIFTEFLYGLENAKN